MRNSNNRAVFVIAEMACSHEGNLSLAKNLVQAAAIAGADAVQLQIWSLTAVMSPQRQEYSFLQTIELSKPDWSQLVAYSRKTFPDLKIYVCPFEHLSIDFIESLQIDGYKLNSSDLSNPLVLKKLASTRKPINLSVGASSLAEIQGAIEVIRETSNCKITLMYGHQNFPTRPDSIHMRYMQKLHSLFELPFGYQDHCDGESEAGFWLPAASVGMGVTVVEKHITHDRRKGGVDHESALNPDEFTRFVQMIRVLETAMGCSTPRPFSTDELSYRDFQKKSVVASRRLQRGSTLEEDDLAFMKAEILGIPPNQASICLGKRIKRDIEQYQNILLDDLQ